MTVSGAGSNPKTTLYVGGLAEDAVNESSLHAAFIPFGDIKDVNIPLDHATGKHRGCVHAWQATSRMATISPQISGLDL